MNQNFKVLKNNRKIKIKTGSYFIQTFWFSRILKSLLADLLIYDFVTSILLRIYLTWDYDLPSKLF